MKKFLAGLLALLMVLGVSSTALAAEPQTADEIMTAVLNAEPGSTIDIELRNDITEVIYLNLVDQTVRIHGNYTLAGIIVDGKGAIDLRVKAIEGKDYEGLYLQDEIDATVVAEHIKGSDDNADPGDCGSAWYGVRIESIGKVEITADIYGGSGFLSEEDFAKEEWYADGGHGLYIYPKRAGNIEITVNGDIYGGCAQGSFGYAGDAVFYDNDEFAETPCTVTLTINGDLIGGDVTADPTVDGEWTLAGDGLYCESSINDQLTIKVTGNISGGHTNGYDGTGGTGIELEWERQTEAPIPATITVTGNVTGGSATGEGDTHGGSGIYAPTDNVTVYGDVTGGDGMEDGHGVYAIVTSDPDAVGSLYVGGTIAPGKSENGQAIYYNTEEYFGDLMPIVDVVINYEYEKLFDMTDEDILNKMFVIMDGLYGESIISEEDMAAFYTAQIKRVAAALGIAVPEDYEITVDDGGMIEDDVIEAIDEAFADLSEDEAAMEALLAEVVPDLIDDYNAIVENADYTMADLGLYATRITAWRLIPGDYADLSFEEMQEIVPAEQLTGDMIQSVERAYESGMISRAEAEAILNDAIREGAKMLGVELPADAKVILYNGQLMPNEAMMDSMAGGEDVFEAAPLEEVLLAVAKSIYQQMMPMVEELPFDGEGDLMDYYRLFKQTVDYIIRKENAANGTVATDVLTVFADEIATVTATPDQGYELSGLSVYDEALTGNTFAGRINGGIVVKASFTKTGNPPTGDGGAVWFTVLAMTAMAGAALLVSKRKKI